MATTTRLPVTYILPLYGGQTESFPVTWTAGGDPVNLTGFTGTVGVWTAARSLIDTATAGAGPSPILGITMTLGGVTGVVTVTFPGSACRTLAGYAGQCQYDVLLASGGVATALMRGPIDASAGRPA